MSDVPWAVVAVVGLLALVCLAALVAHAVLAALAIRRARLEDLPVMLDSSGRTLLGLFKSLRVGVGQAGLSAGPGAGPQGPVADPALSDGATSPDSTAVAELGGGGAQ
ncbi:hypothetical protein ACFYZI_41880 [Streptomyces griseorubiginosus]|uniref:hypothetical protein n=1 Tax=Streptomyces griseorubiginosus TaxID=67304 RepID=UPI0036B362A7